MSGVHVDGQAHGHGHVAGRGPGSNRLTLIIVLALLVGSATGYAMHELWPERAAGFAERAALLPLIFLRLI